MRYLAALKAAIGDMGWKSCYALQITEVIRLYCKLVKMNTSRMTKCIYMYSKSHSGSIYSFVQTLLEKYNIDTNQYNFQSKYEIKRFIAQMVQKVEKDEQETWYYELWNDSKNPENSNKLRLFRLFKDPHRYILRLVDTLTHLYVIGSVNSVITTKLKMKCISF